MDPSPPAESRELLGLSGLRARPPERVPIRTRSVGVTQAGWRMEIHCDRGPGAILLVECAGQSYHRGEGILLGWTQEQLASLYEALRPGTGAEPHDSLQLG